MHRLGDGVGQRPGVGSAVDARVQVEPDQVTAGADGHRHQAVRRRLGHLDRPRLPGQLRALVHQLVQLDLQALGVLAEGVQVGSHGHAHGRTSPPGRRSAPTSARYWRPTPARAIPRRGTAPDRRTTVAVPGASRAAVATGASLAVAAASVVVAVAAAGPAAAAQVCDQPPVADTVEAAVPWSQQAWDPAAQVWPFSTGAGVTVAVLDTGVQTSNPQLAGRVAGGVDLVSGGTADVDCVPHGSGLAGVVVAGQQAGVGLRGLAPDATVLPVQVAQAAVGDPGTTPVEPGVVAAGLDAAVAGGAQVVLVGPVVFRDDPQLADAVQRTLDAGVVVVAGVGDGHDADRDGEGPTAALATPYPAAYPGVLGVAAVGSDGLRADTSQIGDYVDLAAPGAEVVSTGTAAQQVYDGTAFAAAFVAAAAALVVAEPGLVPAGADRPAAVQARLAATAVPPPAPAGYGAGLLSP
ncbi:MAG: S8 family serine peptidase, partial [Actinobacteria bacterium]|nr:S8 family serine peptidase [Actinomycetota bacterium]